VRLDGNAADPEGIQAEILMNIEVNKGPIKRGVEALTIVQPSIPNTQTGETRGTKSLS
jgi:hypothetical protein